MRMGIGRMQVAWGVRVGDMGTRAPAAGDVGCVGRCAGGGRQVSQQCGRQRGWVRPGGRPERVDGGLIVFSM